MQQHPFGPLPPVSQLTLVGGGLGMLWGKTRFAECVATVHAAVEAGIALFDLAPRYGDGNGNGEEVVSATQRSIGQISYRRSRATPLSRTIPPTKTLNSRGSRLWTSRSPTQEPIPTSGNPIASRARVGPR